jgi:deazaflavin-dependent oxidoreductase (nitroreductase family)
LAEGKSYLKPGFVMKRLIGPLALRFGKIPTLTVTGRTSGRPRSLPIGRPVEVNGRRYLVSPRGETHWVRNLRAAGCGSLRSHGVTESFRAVEVEAEERDHAIAAYRAAAGKPVEPAFAKLPDATDHPTFRLDDAVVVSGPNG